MASDATILIVDDEAAIAALLRHTVEKAGWRSAIARSGAEGLQWLRRQRPSLVLLDWMLPDCRGDAVLMQIRADADADICQLPVIMLTAAKMPDDCNVRMGNIADAQLCKPVSPDVLTLRIQALLQCKFSKQTQTLLTAGTLTLDPIQRTVSVDRMEITIDSLEFRLLKVFLSHPGQVFSRRQLVDQVWGMHMRIEDRTVDVHVRRLRKNLQSAQGLIKTVRNGGYMLAH